MKLDFWRYSLGNGSGLETRLEYQNGKVKNPKLSSCDTLFLELQEFAESCMNKKRYRIENEEAAHNVEIMEAIVRSSSRKKIIYLES